MELECRGDYLNWDIIHEVQKAILKQSANM